MDPTTPPSNVRSHRRSPHQPFHQSAYHGDLTTPPRFGPLSASDLTGNTLVWFYICVELTKGLFLKTDIYRQKYSLYTQQTLAIQ